MPRRKESAVIKTGYMIDRGDLNRTDEKYRIILEQLDASGISHLLQDKVKILTNECNELKANARFEGENLKSRVKGRDILINPETLSALLRLPAPDAEDPWDKAAFLQSMTFMRYSGDASKGLLKKNFPEEYKFLAEILGKALLCKPSAHNAVSQDMLKAMAAVAMQRRIHWGKYLFHQIQTFFHNSHHGRILTIFLNKLNSSTFPIDIGKPIHYTRIINHSLFDKWNIRIIPKVTQASSSSHASPPPPLKRTAKKINIKRPTKKLHNASSTIVINEPPSLPALSSSFSPSSQSSSSFEGFDRTCLFLTKPTPPPHHTILEIPLIPSSFQISPIILPSSSPQVLDHTIHLIIPPSASIINPPAIQLEAQGTPSSTEAATETFVKQVEDLAHGTFLAQGSPRLRESTFPSDFGGLEDFAHYDIKEEPNCQDFPVPSFAQQPLDKNMFKEILREVVREEMKVVKAEMNNVNRMISAIKKESQVHWQSIEQKISKCVREINTINVLFRDVQILPIRISSLEDKLLKLEEIVKYEVKKAEAVNEETKHRIDHAMQNLQADIKYLKVIIQDRFDKEKLDSFAAPFDLEDTLSEANDRHPEDLAPSILRA